MYRTEQKSMPWLTGAVLVQGVFTVGLVWWITRLPILDVLLLEVFVVGLIFNFLKLTVEVNQETLTIFFGLGWPKKVIPLREIREAEAVKSPWYYGYGIRWTPGGVWMWNVAGPHSVELTLANGGKFRIGTAEPEALLAAINSR